MSKVMDPSAFPRVGVVGGGGFGKALATAAARNGRDVLLWSRKAQLDAPYRSTTNLSDLSSAELIFLAVPSPYVPEAAETLGAHLDGSHLLVHVSRGLLGDNLTTLSQHLRHATPCRRVGALAGPLDADALREGSPTGAIVGTRFPEVTRAVRCAIGGRHLRIYESQDIVGVEVATAVVGLMALAVGYARGRKMPPATLSVFLTRGMAESVRVGKALGGDPATFRGLAGFGDLLAVVGGDVRPEIMLGQALAEGIGLKSAAQRAGAHIEGVTIAARLVKFAKTAGIEAPMCEVVAQVLGGRIGPDEGITRLLDRQPGRE